MPFCPSCGAPGANSRFCIRCGSPINVAPAPSAPQAPQAAKHATGLKIALILILVFGFLGIGATAGLYYYVKARIHARLATLKQQTGVDLPAIVQSGSQAPAGGPARNGCLMLTKTEAEQILGFSLARADGSSTASTREEHCDYYASAGAISQSRNSTAKRFHDLVNSKSGQANMAQMEELVKGLTAGVNDGSAPILQITIYRGNAKVATSSDHIAGALMGAKPESVAGPWDEALFGPMDSTLTIRKGDNGAMIDLRQIPDARQKGLAIATKIASRL